MPSSAPYVHIEKAIRYLQKRYRNQPSLDDVARYTGLSKYYLQRLFERWAGVSPKEFIQFLSIEHAKRLLREGHTTLSTSYDVGLSGNGRLHDLFVKMEAVTPGEFQRNGDGVTVHFGYFNTLFGEALIAETQKGICWIQFVLKRATSEKQLRSYLENATFINRPGKLSRDVARLLNGKPRRRKAIPLELKGTAFQVKVWAALLKIPRGSLVTYQKLAEMVGSPRACRAVGSAVGDNPIGYIIPCHRVIKSDGSIGGYAGGIARKAAMIGWESSKQQTD